MILVNQIIPFSNVDGEGNRCSIFLQECNIRCLYCHNSETINRCRHCGLCVKGCPSGALTITNGVINFDKDRCIECDQCIRTCPYDSTPKSKKYTTQEILSIISSYEPYIRGITVSGGEALLQYEGITAIFKALEESKLTRYIDTNGFVDIRSMWDLIDVTDGFLFDVKALKNQQTLCGAESEFVISNLKLLAEKNKLTEVRTVIFNDLVDIDNVIMEVAKILVNYPDVPYRLIRGHLTGLREDKKSVLAGHKPSMKDMTYYLSMAKKTGLTNVFIT